MNEILLHHESLVTCYLRLPFPRFFGVIIDWGSHSLTGSTDEVVCASVLGEELTALVTFPASAFAEAAAISSGLTSSPLLMRAAISGVTRIRRTLVWKPGAERLFSTRTEEMRAHVPPFPIPWSLSRRARYHFRVKYAERKMTGGILWIVHERE